MIKAYAGAFLDTISPKFGWTDSFFSYLDDHLAVLLNATAKAPNQYLIISVVTTSGAIGRIALRLGGPVDKEKVDYPRSHPLFVHWFGLLEEGFNLSHTLMRSFAATEALEQMSLLTNAAILAGHGEHVRVTALPGFQKIHKTCILKADAYHTSMAGDCLIKILKIWLFALVQPSTLAAVASDHICAAVQEMVLLQHALPRQFSTDLKDPATVLCVKSSTDSYTLQDICMCILSWDFKDDWQRNLGTDKVIEIIDLLKTVSVSAGTDWASVKTYTEAIYEIAFLIFKGTPPGLDELHKRAARYRHQDDESRQDALERHAGEVTRELIENWFDPKREWHDCEHSLFSTVGLAAVAFKAGARARQVRCAGTNPAIFSHDRRNPEEWGRRTGRALGLSAIVCRMGARPSRGSPTGGQLVNDVAHGRPFYSGYMSGRSGNFGYPQVELGFAFFLVVPRNLQLTDKDGALFHKWQGMAVEPNMMRDTYERVWAIRGPLQDQIRERRMKKKDAPKNIDTDSK